MSCDVGGEDAGALVGGSDSGAHAGEQFGWMVFFFMFRTETDVNPDAGLDEVDQYEAVSDAEPKQYS